MSERILRSRPFSTRAMAVIGVAAVLSLGGCQDEPKDGEQCAECITGEDQCNEGLQCGCFFSPCFPGTEGRCVESIGDECSIL